MMSMQKVGKYEQHHSSLPGHPDGSDRRESIMNAAMQLSNDIGILPACQALSVARASF